MLRCLTLREFRAFKRQSFHFSKVNILAGRNNSGKSSALSALNLLAQTVQERELDGSPLVLNGQYDQLGTFIDAVHGNLARRPIGIDLAYDEFSIALDFKYRTQRREIELQRFELWQENNELYRYMAGKDSFQSKVHGKNAETYFRSGRKVRPNFRNFWPVQVVSPQDIIKNIEASRAKTEDLIRYSEFQSELSQAASELNSHFGGFESVSAFRDKPSRTYLYTGETARSVGITGSNTAQILAQDAAKRGHGKGSLIGAISEWFKETGIAQSVFVNSLTSRHFEICVVSNDGSEHNICDVGFGCSQVLPVLLGGLRLFRGTPRSNAKKIYVVQEPEIHLHPNAQAELGTFFVDLANRGGQVFVETHSDNLILRVASHVADGKINSNDVSIFWVGDDPEHTVTSIKIGEDGVFDPPWPGGFFPQRSLETTNLARSVVRRDPAQRVRRRGRSGDVNVRSS